MNLPVRSKIPIPFLGLILISSIVVPVRSQNSIRIIGSVVDPGSYPIAGAHITLYSLDRILQTTSDPSGHFQFSAVPAGKYEFEVVAPGFKRFTKSNTFVTDPTRTAVPDKPMDLSVGMLIGDTGSPREIIPVMEVAPTGSCGPGDAVSYEPRQPRDADALRGIVINRYPKMPVAHATVELIDATGAEIARQQTNERGEFQFKQIAPGRYHIALQDPGYNHTQSIEFWVARENATFITMQAVQPGNVVVCQ